MARFGKTVKLTAFRPFTSASDSLEQINAVSEGQLTDELKHFLEQNLPKVRESRQAGFDTRDGPQLRHAHAYARQPALAAVA